MVHKSFSTSSSIKGSHKLFRLLIVTILLGTTVAILVFFVLQTSFHGNMPSYDSTLDYRTDSPSIEGGPNIEEKPAVEFAEINFQPLVDDFVNSTQGDKGVLIYDLDLQKNVGEYNPDSSFSTASLYKLFVVYEGYRRLDRGEWDGNEFLGAAGHTVLECLDLAIRESNSSCAETLWSKIGRSELDRIIINDFGIVNTEVSAFKSTPSDILKVMKLFYDHPDISSDGLVSRMQDSFLVQPKTEYDWRQGLPSGFIKANVYNKVGWDYNPGSKYWNIYNDAAIVEFPENDRHFIVAVMTSRVSFEKISELGARIEDLVYTSH